MKRMIMVLMVCLLTACCMAGCGGNQKNDSSSAGSDTSAVSADSAAEDSQKDDSTAKDDSKNTSETSKDKTSQEGSQTQESSSKNSQTEQNSQTEKSDTETSVASNGGEEDSDMVITIDGDQSGITIDEDGNITIDPDVLVSGDDSEEPPENSENDVDDDGSEFLDLSYQMTYLSPEGFSGAASLPKAYYITSAAELSDFIENNSKTYSLAVDHTDNSYIEPISFVTKTKDMDSTYFETSDALIVVTAYAKGDDCDLGSVVVKDNEATVEIWAQKPASASDTGYACIMVNIEKNALKDKTITAFVNAEAFAEDGEEA